MKKNLFFAFCVAAAVVACQKPDSNKDPKPEPEKPIVQTRVLEDFEGDGILTWTGADGATFAQVDNPKKEGINTSAKVGKVTASGAQWEFVWSTGFGETEDGGFDFLNFSKEGYIVKVMVMAPKAGAPVFLKLEGVDVNACEIGTVKTSKANEWEVLEFDYEPFSLVDGAYKNFVILFDAGVESEGGDEWYFDNIELCKE